MARRKKIYEGKAKILYEGPEPGTIVQYFKDDATAFNAQKKDVIEGKGVLNNRCPSIEAGEVADASDIITPCNIAIVRQVVANTFPIRRGDVIFQRIACYLLHLSSLHGFT